MTALIDRVYAYLSAFNSVLPLVECRMCTRPLANEKLAICSHGGEGGSRGFEPAMVGREGRGRLEDLNPRPFVFATPRRLTVSPRVETRKHDSSVQKNTYIFWFANKSRICARHAAAAPCGHMRPIGGRQVRLRTWPGRRLFRCPPRHAAAAWRAQIRSGSPLADANRQKCRYHLKRGVIVPTCVAASSKKER